MNYRGPSFLVVVWFGSSPNPYPLPLPSVSSTCDTQEDWERETTCWQETRGGDGGGAKLCDGEKAWSSINHSLLSGCNSSRLTTNYSGRHLLLLRSPAQLFTACFLYNIFFIWKYSIEEPNTSYSYSWDSVQCTSGASSCSAASPWLLYDTYSSF